MTLHLTSSPFFRMILEQWKWGSGTHSEFGKLKKVQILVNDNVETLSKNIHLHHEE